MISMDIDQELLKQCEKKDRRAQFQLYRDCYSILMSVCVRYEKNVEDAKELVNMGFMKIATNLDKYKTNVPFEAWIRRIMLNTIIDEFRKRKKEKEHLTYTDFEEGTYDVAFSEESKVLEEMKIDDIQLMLHKLAPVSKQVFNLYAIDGYSHKEIGNMLDISEGTSKWHVSSARKTLKKLVYEAMKVAKVLVL